jgi:hypothetical protein
MKLCSARQVFLAVVVYGIFTVPSSAQSAAPSPFSGTVVLTANASLLARPLPSLNEKLTLDYTPAADQVFDLRIENYTESSFNENPPGDLSRNVNEHKFEVQATYIFALSSMFSLSAALLHHENFTFADTYFWGVGTLTATIPLVKDALTLIVNASLEKRLSGGRFFYDTSTTLDYVFAPDWTFEANYHRYENFGQLDPSPTQKQEYEIGFIHPMFEHQTLALSYFRHEQFGAPNDQFSFVKLKWGYSL